MNSWIISIDIAKNFDRTSIAIFEKCNDFQPDGRCVSYIIARDLKQIEKMPYTELGRLLVRLDSNADLHSNNDLLVDSTGVGEGVCDILEEMGLLPNRVIITSGGHSRIKRESKGFGGFAPRTTFNVPKAELIDTLKIGLEQRRVRVASGIPFEDDIIMQFSHFVGELTPRTKKITYNNDDPNVHDDIVSSFAMAAWFFLQEDGAMRDFLYDNDKTYGTVAMKVARGSKPEMADYNFESTL